MQHQGIGSENDGQPVIRVIGLGGAGTNAVCHMVDQGIEGVDFICANTDVQHLERAHNAAKLALGSHLTQGLGAGADPKIGAAAAEYDRDRIRAELENSDMVFITAGMGGGTGTGSAPIVAEIAREVNALTVAVVTKPFQYEGNKRMAVAEEGLNKLVGSVDSLIVIPNQRLIEYFGKSFGMKDAFAKANEVLDGAVRGISDVATKTGYINVDFEDVRTVMTVRGTAMMGTGRAEGENRAEEAVKQALACPLLEDMDVRNASGVLVNISGADVELGETQLIMDQVQERANQDAQVVFGCLMDPSYGNELRVTVIMTGMNRAPKSSVADAPLPVQQMASVAQVSEVAATEPPAVSDEQLLDIPSLLRNQINRSG
ncbi:MAG: cell division protein FtsZ [Gammaproteobacteria bacterium]